jgi:hypothetical protein
VTFKTAPFAEEVEFTGPVKLKLWVRSTTVDMDIFAALRLIDPEGREVTFHGGQESHVPVSYGYLRVSHRALDPKRSTEHRPYHSHLAIEPLTPGQMYETDVEIWPTSIVVPKGYRLALTVQGKDWEYPADARIVQAKDYELPAAEAGVRPGDPEHASHDPGIFGGTNTILTGASHASYLLMPLIPKER